MIDSDHQVRIAINTAIILSVDVVISIAVDGSTGEASLVYSAPAIMDDDDIRSILLTAAGRMTIRRAPDA